MTNDAPRVAICGSMAYDTIMVFEGKFKEHILPDQVHILNVSFLVPAMRQEFGGCAGNIAYNLKLLGGEPVPVAAVGEDERNYLERFRALGIDSRCIMQVPGTYTAQCFITTDLDDNQITAFHPGAMMQSHRNRIADAGQIAFGIVAPDGKDGMLQHAGDFAAAGVPFIFDPGQALPLYSGPELLQLIELASFVTVNDYEARLVSDKTGKSLAELAQRVDALIVTRGGEGSEIHAKGEVMQVPCVKAEKIADPTGCGDAYRAGLLYGMARGFDWGTSGRLASLMGSIKVGFQGGQNHRPSQQEIADRFREAFGYAY
jgi:adenosine kinase